MTRQAIINVFARAPIRGRVKTRLAADIGEIGALGVYRRLLRHTISQALGADARTVLWIDGGRWHPFWAGSGARKLKVQPPGDLGHRMDHALRWSLSRSSRAIVVGSDCPGISTRLLEIATEHLKSVDVVIGPAADGGYYLIGMSRPAPQLFRGIAWGGPDVCARTVSRARRTGLTCAVLPTLGDVDRAADLVGWRGLSRLE